MQTSLRTLLAKVVDYAGLFPPAQLPLEHAMATYSRHQKEAHAWMLGLFVIPASRLLELNLFVRSGYTAESPLELSVLGRGGASTGEFLENLALDLENVATARAEFGDRVRMGVLETRVPLERGFASMIGEATEQLDQSQLAPFFEMPLTANPVEAISQGVHACNSQGRAGLKLRCGGTDRSAFPATATLAHFITECVVARVPMKFTAGLHHPLPRRTKELPKPMHGFINIFLGSVFSVEHRLAQATLCELLEEETPGAFRWESNQLGWRGYRVQLPEVELARRFNATSFGSCSFEEPIADLQALQWM